MQTTFLQKGLGMVPENLMQRLIPGSGKTGALSSFYFHRQMGSGSLTSPVRKSSAAALHKCSLSVHPIHKGGWVWKGY